MDLIRTLLTIGFYLLATPLAALIAVPHALITRRAEFLYKVGMSAAALGMRIAGVHVVVEGLERFDPNGTYLFLSNHASNLDPPVLLPRIPRRTSVLAKKQLFRLPILGYAMRVARLVPVDRHHRERAIESLTEAAEVLRAGINMTIFVEGTRSPDGCLLPFKKGPFFVAMDASVPVVPVTIAGSSELLPKGRWIVHRGQVRLVFHEPLNPTHFSDREALMNTVRERIASALPTPGARGDAETSVDRSTQDSTLA